MAHSTEPTALLEERLCACHVSDNVRMLQHLCCGSRVVEFALLQSLQSLETSLIENVGFKHRYWFLSRGLFVCFQRGHLEGDKVRVKILLGV